jgi:hypothetical protein
MHKLQYYRRGGTDQYQGRDSIQDSRYSSYLRLPDNILELVD